MSAHSLIRVRCNIPLKTHFLCGAAVMTLLASAAEAQVAGAQKTADPALPVSTGQANPASVDQARQVAQVDSDAQPGQDIVVTGSILRRTSTESASPVTVLTASTLDDRGITTTSDAIRSIAADSSGTVPNSFVAGFGAGASGVSLRGLTVDSTLVLFDGLRGAKYPLSDDGERSFTDLNTIPDAIIDRIEVLKDGASSTYGSDAIAGVVNVITKREIRGIEGRVESGVSQRGDAGHQRASLTAGYGDLAEQHWNFYISGEYQHDSLVHAQDRGFPYNNLDLTSLGGLNGNPGAAGPGATSVAVVLPAIEAIPGNILSGVPIPGGLSQPLGNGCGTLITHTDATGTYCEENPTDKYSTLSPELTKYGVTAHLSVDFGADNHAYATGTYYDSRSYSEFWRSNIMSGKPISTLNIVLPAVLSNGQLNPNDPYAAAGQAALIYYRFGDLPGWSETNAVTYRAAAGVNGKFGDGWSYTFDATGMKTDLHLSSLGILNIPALFSAIQDGTYNFVNPSLNSAAVRNALAPPVRNIARSALYGAQGSLSKDLFSLPGGALQFGVGAQVRYELINDPDQNAAHQFLGINEFQAVGHRTVTSGYFEIDAPILTTLDIQGSGRFDHYSEGFNNFSPKIGFKFTPIPQIALRGTFSRGFRAPSIPETSGSVIGYVNSPALPDYVIAAHHNDAYVQTYRLGENTTGTPSLKPEKSRSFTFGAIVQPTRALSLTVDYYNIRKTNFISPGPFANDAINDYYAQSPLPAGYSIIQNPADPNYPNAVRTVQEVDSPYVNSSAFQTSGLDVSAQLRLKLAPDVKLTSVAEATTIFQSNLIRPDGSILRYVGTEGPYNVSSSGGTPRWKGNWQNTLEVGPYSLTAIAYYVSGYRETAEDSGGPNTGQDCANDLYNPKFCHVRSFIDVDMTGSVRVNDRFSFYVNVLNVFDAKAPLNPANYGAGDMGENYDPAFAQAGAMGRMFRAGATFKF